MLNTHTLFEDIPAGDAAILRQAFHLAADKVWEQGTLAPIIEHGPDKDHSPKCVVDFAQHICWHVANSNEIPEGTIYSVAAGIMLACVAQDMQDMFEYYCEKYSLNTVHERMLREYGFVYDENWHQTVDYYAGLLWPHEMCYGATPDNLQQMMIYMQEETNKARLRYTQYTHFDTMAIEAGGHRIEFENTKENRFRFKKMLLEMSGSTHDPTGEVDWTKDTTIFEHEEAGEDEDVFYSDKTGGNDAFKKLYGEYLSDADNDPASKALWDVLKPATNIHEACPYDVTLELVEAASAKSTEPEYPGIVAANELKALDGTILELGMIVTLVPWATAKAFIDDKEHDHESDYPTLCLCIEGWQWANAAVEQRTINMVYQNMKCVGIGSPHLFCIVPPELIASAKHQSPVPAEVPTVATEYLDPTNEAYCTFDE